MDTRSRLFYELNLLSMIVGGSAPCALHNDSTCAIPGDSLLQRSLSSYRTLVKTENSEGADCKSWCNPSPDTCTWKVCAGCAACADIQLCSSECVVSPETCTWPSCAGCDGCPTPAPTDAPTPAPTAAGATPYVPGTPGAPWSEDEILAVRSKIHRLIQEGRALTGELGLKWIGDQLGTFPNAAKLLRLGFHDCLKYVDGTGGCDGCLNWKGVGRRYWNLVQGEYNHPGDDGGNNGFSYTVDVLEAIYTDPNFPGYTPRLPISLQQSGKSRADLWAFATLVAVEYSVALNNKICEEPENDDQCHPRVGMPDCKVSMPRNFKFKTGRRDCVTALSPSYKNDKEELHPDPQSNGAGTLNFFKRDFGFSASETVAIMGGHTLGKNHVMISMFRYGWKSKSNLLFNNGYFRNLARKRDWLLPSDCKKRCCRAGDDKGERPIARWLPHVRGDTKFGGPVQWIQEKYVCPTSKNKKSVKAKKCNKDKLRWKYVNGDDETALSCEMGLYIKFDVNETTRVPYGCAGLEDFNIKKWGGPKAPNYKYTWSTINGWKAEPRCPLNTDIEPGDTKPLYQIVEEFADDNQAFLSVFVPTLERMLANGYSSDELQEAPESDGSFASCPYQKNDNRGRYYSCLPK